MRAGTLISVEEYLSTHYDPDCDYVEGEVLERNAGEQDHSRMQMVLGARLYQLENTLQIRVFPEQRIQVRRDRFRIPDLCVVLGKRPAEQVFTSPPFLCVEILSPSDSMEKMQERIDDYLQFGVPFVWLISPRSRRGWTYTKDSIVEARDGVLRTANPDLAVPLGELFDED